MCKKVLIAATTAKGHINVFHVPYIKMFREKGWTVDVVTNGDEKVPFASNEYSISIKRSPFSISNVFAIIQMIRIMQKNRYDIVMCHTPMGGVVTRIAAYITKTKPVIYMAHGFHFYKGAPFINAFLFKNIEKILASCTDGLITINKEDYKAAKKFKIRKNGKVYLIPGIGTDLYQIKNTNIDALSKRQELGIPENAFVVLNVGELIDRKNQDSAIKAISRCKNKNIILVICGRGVNDCKLKKLSKDLNIEERIIFCGFRKDVYEIMKMADVFLFPSFQEGLPVSVMEAMASGLPIICSDIRGNRDLINNNGGYLVNPLDIEKMSYYIDFLYQNPNLRKLFGENNKKESEKYDLKKVILNMQSIIEEITGNCI